jgi:hypothetical protein
VGRERMTGNIDDVTNFVRAIAWPLVILTLLIVYRRQIGQMANRVSGRLSRVSVGIVSVDLAIASDVSSVVTTLSGIRDPVSTVSFGDSGTGLLTSVREGEVGDYTVIDLGRGNRWLTSRLFLFAVVLPELLGVQRLVFVESTERVVHRFVGMGDPRAVSTALGDRYEWLPRALLCARANFTDGRLFSEFDKYCQLKTETQTGINLYGPEWQQIVYDILPIMLATDLSSQSRTSRFTADMMVSRFLGHPLIRDERLDTTDPSDWIRITSRTGPDYLEHAKWIESGVHLLEILGTEAVSQNRIVKSLGIAEDELSRQVLTMEEDFVTIVDSNDVFGRLVSRRELADVVAREATNQK